MLLFCPLDDARNQSVLKAIKRNNICPSHPTLFSIPSDRGEFKPSLNVFAYSWARIILLFAGRHWHTDLGLPPFIKSKFQSIFKLAIRTLLRGRKICIPELQYKFLRYHLHGKWASTKNVAGKTGSVSATNCFRSFESELRFRIRELEFEQLRCCRMLENTRI